MLTILPIGDRIYVGGSFDSVTYPSGVSFAVKNLAVFSPRTRRSSRPRRSAVRRSGGPAVRLDWTLPPDRGSPITKYVVLRDGVRLVSLTATPTGPLTYPNTTVISGTTYSYQVRVVNAIGSGQLSNKAVVTIP